MSQYLIPSVIEKTPRGERVADVFSRLLSERIVFVGVPIDDGVANAVIAQLLHLASAEPEKDISLYINSPGGAFSASLAIYDTMALIPNDLATVCIGQASSTAALLLAAGAPGKRSVLPHSRVLLSQPHTGLTQGSISDLALEAAELAQVRAETETLLARHTGRTEDTIRADTDRVLVLRAAAAVDYGIADQLLETSGRQQSGIETLARPQTAVHP